MICVMGVYTGMQMSMETIGDRSLWSRSYPLQEQRLLQAPLSGLFVLLRQSQVAQADWNLSAEA